MLRRDAVRGAARLPWPLLAGLWGALLLAVMVLRQPAVGYVTGYVTDPSGSGVWSADLLCRGLDGPALGQVWFGQTDRGGRVTVAGGTGTVEAEAYSDGRRTPAQKVTLSEGESADLRFRLPRAAAHWRWESGLGIFAPETVFTTDETPWVGLTGAAPGQQANLSLDRLDTAALMQDKGGRPWLSAWGGAVENRSLRDLAPYLRRVREQAVPIARRQQDSEFQAYAQIPVTEPGCYVVTVSVEDTAERFAFRPVAGDISGHG